MQNLNLIKENFRIVRLSSSDAKERTDNLQILRELILPNEEMYPDISNWMDKKVFPGLKTGERIAFLGLLGEKPVVSAVVKRGAQTKFCHLRIDDNFQNNNLGDLFFSLMALEVRNMAQSIHFTLPEGLWEQKKSFFHSFGFKNVQSAEVQYRFFEKELECSASFETVWQHTLNKLCHLSSLFSVSGYSMSHDLLMSIRPQYASRVLSGHKRVEIRKKFSERWIGHRACLYASYPTRSLVGEAKISNVTAGAPEKIWVKFGAQIGCTEAEFHEYTKSAVQIYAIELDEVSPYCYSVSLEQASSLLNEDLKPPQSYCCLDEGKGWSKAVSIAAMLHGSVKSRNDFYLDCVG